MHVQCHWSHAARYHNRRRPWQHAMRGTNVGATTTAPRHCGCDSNRLTSQRAQQSSRTAGQPHALVRHRTVTATSRGTAACWNSANTQAKFGWVGAHAGSGQRDAGGKARAAHTLVADAAMTRRWAQTAIAESRKRPQTSYTSASWLATSASWHLLVRVFCKSPVTRWARPGWRPRWKGEADLSCTRSKRVFSVRFCFLELTAWGPANREGWGHNVYIVISVERTARRSMLPICDFFAGLYGRILHVFVRFAGERNKARRTECTPPPPAYPGPPHT